MSGALTGTAGTPQFGWKTVGRRARIERRVGDAGNELLAGKGEDPLVVLLDSMMRAG